MAEGGKSLILAVDTCSGRSSIALARGGADACELLGQVELVAEWTSTALHVEIANLLGRHSLSTAAIDGYAVTNGPGSFTAVRVGTAAVKGLAEVHGRPVAAISTLALIAQAAAWQDASAPADALWVPLLDARRAQVFSGIYMNTSAGVELAEPESVSALRVVLERCRTLGAAHIHFCSPDMDAFTETLAAAELAGLRTTAVPPLLAGALARMGLQTIARTGGRSAVEVDANYIRASDAELFWKG